MFTAQELSTLKQIVESSSYRGADVRLVVTLLDKIDSAIAESNTQKQPTQKE